MPANAVSMICAASSEGQLLAPRSKDQGRGTGKVRTARARGRQRLNSAVLLSRVGGEATDECTLTIEPPTRQLTGRSRRCLTRRCPVHRSVRRNVLPAFGKRIAATLPSRLFSDIRNEGRVCVIHINFCLILRQAGTCNLLAATLDAVRVRQDRETA